MQIWHFIEKLLQMPNYRVRLCFKYFVLTGFCLTSFDLTKLKGVCATVIWWQGVIMVNNIIIDES